MYIFPKFDYKTTSLSQSVCLTSTDWVFSSLFLHFTASTVSVGALLMELHKQIHMDSLIESHSEENPHLMDVIFHRHLFF